jgi:dihydrodipicolinate synthase/N-acetylneuraminate lyase
MHCDLGKSVLAVPPLARNVDLTLNKSANGALIRHLEQGGISTLMYGGNANFYNVGLYEYAGILEMLLELAGADTWVIPSVGTDFGKMMDQAEVLRDRPFPTAMVLPAVTAFTVAGVETGICRFAERLGKPVILYVKAESYLPPAAIRRLVDGGVVKAIKYAIVRENPSQDPYLSELTDLIDRRLVMSGIGERPAIVHMKEFGLSSFTSGSVCIAPRASQGILAALKHGDNASAERLRAAFIPIEDCRDAYNPARVLHEAVTLSGIADMGPMLPLMSNLDAVHVDKVRAAARNLLKFNNSAAVPVESAAA